MATSIKTISMGVWNKWQTYFPPSTRLSAALSRKSWTLWLPFGASPTNSRALTYKCKFKSSNHRWILCTIRNESEILNSVHQIYKNRDTSKTVLTLFQHFLLAVEFHIDLTILGIEHTWFGLIHIHFTR